MSHIDSIDSSYKKEAFIFWILITVVLFVEEGFRQNSLSFFNDEG